MGVYCYYFHDSLDFALFEATSNQSEQKEMHLKVLKKYYLLYCVYIARLSYQVCHTVL